VSSGEGCSIHGGCASCPYMKVGATFLFVINILLQYNTMLFFIAKMKNNL
jgi:hypothetical protein